VILNVEWKSSNMGETMGLRPHEIAKISWILSPNIAKIELRIQVIMCFFFGCFPTKFLAELKL
jgi:hypothetical protein